MLLKERSSVIIITLTLKTNLTTKVYKKNTLLERNTCTKYYFCWLYWLTAKKSFLSYLTLSTTLF